MALLSKLVFLAIFFASPITANFRMRCADFPGAHRIDPIVSPGRASQHSHLIHGAQNFGLSTTYDDLRASACSTCQVPEDKSAYWIPSLHFLHDGIFEAVPQVGGLAVYYFFRSNFANDPVTPFPPGFQMVAGDSTRREFKLPVPDPETSFWKESDFKQEALRQKALGFNCLHYKANWNENTLFRHFMPNKTFIDENCPDGIRIELAFPSCWNGKDLDSPDHKSHVAYPNFVQSGECPKGFPIRFPTLLFEVIFNTQANKAKDGQYVFSNGDTTGFGNHGDFYNGWDPAFLQKAINQCTDPFADITKCPLFKLQSDEEFGACATKFRTPVRVASENCAAKASSLCGNNPVYGMAAAAPPALPPSSGADVAPAPAPPPAVQQPPPPAAPPVVQPPPPPAAEAPQPTIAPIAPPQEEPQHAHTLTSTIDGKKMIVFVDEVMVTEEVTMTISPTDAPPAAPAQGTNLPHQDPPPPPAVAPPPPAVTDAPKDKPLAPMYTETILEEVTATVYVKRHEHHPRGHPHRRR
ncbi:WSC domain-containing protein [Venturia nashicola]|nr:WSC domain-containing protein [Venturia nashicola]